MKPKIDPQVFLEAAERLNPYDDSGGLGYCCPAIAIVMGARTCEAYDMEVSCELTSCNKFFSSLFKPTEEEAAEIPWEPQYGWWGLSVDEGNQPPRVFALLFAYWIAKDMAKKRRTK